VKTPIRASTAVELVIRQRLSLGVITFSDRLKEGIAACNRMAQRQPVARRTRVEAFLLDALHKRVSASEKHDRARGESVRGSEWTHVLLTGAVVCDDLVRKRQLAPRDRA
jgi:hypothetical protein